MADQFSEKAGEAGQTAVGEARLERLAARAALAIKWERAWPHVAAISILIGVFLTLSWLGLWLELPRPGRIGGCVLFGLALGAILVRLARIQRPSRRDALARLDRDSGIPHRPASGLFDRLGNAGDDPATRALWQLHRRRLFEAARRLRLVPPSPRMVDRDRYAVRAAALVAIVAAGFVAGPEKFARVAAAVDWRSDGAIAKGFRLDAWIDPPAYTGKPPILLPAHPDAPPATADAKAQKIQAPVGSIVVVRVSGDPEIVIDAAGGLAASEPAKPTDKSPPGAAPPDPTTTAQITDKNGRPSDRELRWTLKGDAKLVLRRGDRTIVAFDIGSVPDQPPTIELTEPPTANARGSLTLSYKLADDYGVIGAEAAFARPVLRGKAITGRTLAEPPRLALALPSAPGGLGQGQTTTDLSEHPWAGARVSMTMSARDEGGNTGKTSPVEVTLPQRPFVKPLARALVEQRRNLVLAPDDRARVAAALDGLTIAPERFTPEAGIYLGLQAAKSQLNTAKSDEDLRSVADLLWAMALQIEDGGLSDAERALRAAEQQLREAMQRGASDAEIRKLTEELRAALDKFMSEMAQQLRDQKNGQNAGRSQKPSRWVTPQDLKSMLDRMDEMARSGDLAEAQQMLDQLQSILENLKSARPSGPSDPMTQEMEQSLDELDRMTRDQQALRDDTFRDGQHAKQRRSPKRKRPDTPGQQGQGQDGQAEDGDQGDDRSVPNGDDQSGSQGLEGRQQGLREQLDALRRRMKQLGMSGEQGLDEADGAMGDAQQSLGQGQHDKAVDAQGRALEGLRRGAQGLAQQMQQQNGENGQADGSDGRDAPGNQRGNRQGQRDPLDRPSRFDRDIARGGLLNVGPGAAQRAQQVLEELRKRLADPSRPQIELDYLERLLRRY